MEITNPTLFTISYHWERLRPGRERVAKNEMVGLCHRLNGHEFEQTPGDSEGQGNLACCIPWGCRVPHDLVTEQQQDLIEDYSLRGNYSVPQVNCPRRDRGGASI